MIHESTRMITNRNELLAEIKQQIAAYLREPVCPYKPQSEVLPLQDAIDQLWSVLPKYKHDRHLRMMILTRIQQLRAQLATSNSQLTTDSKNGAGAEGPVCGSGRKDDAPARDGGAARTAAVTAGAGETTARRR